jgi:ribosomal protein L37E
MRTHLSPVADIAIKVALVFLVAFNVITIKGVIIIAAFYVVRWFIRLPVPPDPWETEIPPGELDKITTQVCERCFTPVAHSRQHYCATCGNATSDLARYIPFVNIAFNYSIFATLWQRIRQPETPLVRRAIAVVIILLFVPVMLAIGVPLLIYRKLKGEPAE